MKKKTLLLILSSTIAATAGLLFYWNREKDGVFACIEIDSKFPNGDILVSKYTRGTGLVEGITVNGKIWKTKYEAYEDKQSIKYTEINGSDYKPIFSLDKETMRLKVMVYNGKSFYYQCEWEQERR